MTSLVTVETAAAAIGIEPRVLVDMAVLGGCPQAYGPMRAVPGSDYRIMLDLADVEAWHAAGRPIADTSYRAPWRPLPGPPPPMPPPPQSPARLPRRDFPSGRLMAAAWPSILAAALAVVAALLTRGG